MLHRLYNWAITAYKGYPELKYSIMFNRDLLLSIVFLFNKLSKAALNPDDKLIKPILAVDCCAVD